jgi:galactokinase
MDQLAAGLGQADHALIIDCRDLTITPAPIPEGVAIVVCDTQVKHALVDGEYRARREDCDEARKILGLESMRDATLEQVEQHREALGDRLFRRARHAATENGRVIRLAAALEASDIDNVAELLRQGHDSLRDDYEVSCPELDALVDAAYEFGVDRGLLGARMTGGGFGGSTISLVRADAAEDLKAHLEASFRAKFGRDPNCFITRASDGAHASPLH